MRWSSEALTHAVGALASVAVPHNGRLRLVDAPADVLVRGGCDATGAAFIVAALTRQGVLVPFVGNGAEASLELRPDALANTRGSGAVRGEPARRIAVLIDYPNAAKTLQNRGEVLSVDRIRVALHDLGEIRLIRVFLDADRVPSEVRKDLREMDVAIEDCPRDGWQETVDKLLIERAGELLETDTVDTFAIVANDNDYARDVLLRVRDRQRMPILLLADPVGSAALKEAAGGQWRFIGGSTFMPEVASFLQTIVDDLGGIATLAERHPIAADAMGEIIRYGIAIEEEMHQKGKSGYFSLKYLRDRIRSDHTTDLPHIATIEEQTACVLRLSDIGVLTPFMDEGQVVHGRYIVARAHPLTVFVCTAEDVVEAHVARESIH